MTGSGGPTADQYAALRNVVHAQSEMLKAQSEMMRALGKKVEIISTLARQTAESAFRTKVETHYAKGLIAALTAEIAGRCENPNDEIREILRRVELVGDELSGPSERITTTIENMRELVSQYAEHCLEVAGSDSNNGA